MLANCKKSRGAGNTDGSIENSIHKNQVAEASARQEKKFPDVSFWNLGVSCKIPLELAFKISRLPRDESLLLCFIIWKQDDSFGEELARISDREIEMTIGLTPRQLNKARTSLYSQDFISFFPGFDYCASENIANYSVKSIWSDAIWE